ncbi:MAG: DNA primase small subunit domain-containing protein [Candidatus Pacearchaeota archaeon]
MEKSSVKEQRIDNVKSLYYSRKDIQDAIYNFSKNREIAPSFMMRSFGKRPDTFQYSGDIFSLVNKGATSFHCSEEIWEDPLKISTDLNREQLNKLRKGWDLLFDIDSKYMDYSKILAKIIINILRFYGVKNFGIKFSGSKGFHIIVPWKAFPKEINGVMTSDMFPEWPRIITQFIMNVSKKELIEKVTDLTKEEFGQNKYIKDFEAPKEVVPDLILVSSRHLFRMPYSLHEKTSLASVVINPDKIGDFQPKDADPLKIKVRNFMPEAEEGEATELLREALDWYKNKNPEENQKIKERIEYKPLKVTNLSEDIMPPSIKKILEGIGDGRKRALFIILNFFRSIGMDKDEIEKRIKDWNEKNEAPLKEGYIKSQLLWSYRNKVVPPPNYDKDYYKGIGITPTDEELRYKNPLNYVSSKNKQKDFKKKSKKSKKSKQKNKIKKNKNKDNFKNKD